MTAEAAQVKAESSEAPTIPEDVLEAITPKETKTDPWTKDELDAIATTVAGECYDDKVQDLSLIHI